jgi:hypothetical protein
MQVLFAILQHDCSTQTNLLLPLLLLSGLVLTRLALTSKATTRMALTRPAMTSELGCQHSTTAACLPHSYWPDTALHVRMCNIHATLHRYASVLSYRRLVSGAAVANSLTIVSYYA